MSWALADLERRLANIVRFGVVAELNVAEARVRVSAGGLLTAWLPWLTQRAGPDRTWWAPEPGEQVVLLAPSGDLTQAVVLPALYRLDHPAPADAATVHRTVYSDGTVIEYDRAVHHLRAIIADGTAEISAPNGITLRGPVTIVGDITHSGSQMTSGDVVASGISLVDHVHGEVAAGAEKSGPPE